MRGDSGDVIRDQEFEPMWNLNLKFSMITDPGWRSLNYTPVTTFGDVSSRRAYIERGFMTHFLSQDRTEIQKCLELLCLKSSSILVLNQAYFKDIPMRLVIRFSLESIRTRTKFRRDVRSRGGVVSKRNQECKLGGKSVLFVFFFFLSIFIVEIWVEAPLSIYLK